MAQQHIIDEAKAAGRKLHTVKPKGKPKRKPKPTAEADQEG